MKNILLTGIFAVILSHVSFSQEYSYTHYDITDGLAGSSLYCITQDKDGFIWTGTDAGVSRFDGTHFRNFTTKDGLPDLEILQMFCDSQGRIWMAPFRKAVCYYDHGRIYNQSNDALLSRIHLQHNVESFAEDAHGNILIQERNALHLLKTDGSVIRYDSLGGLPIRDCLTVSRSASGNFQAQIGAKIIEFSPKECLHVTDITPFLENPVYLAMNPTLLIYEASVARYVIRSFPDNRSYTWTFFPKRYARISFSLVGDSLAYSNTASGTTEYNVRTGQTRQFLPGIRISKVYRDAFGNLWFTSLGKGLYRLNSNDTKIIRLSVGAGESSSILAMAKIGKQLFVGDDHEGIFRLSLPDMKVRDSKPFTYYCSNRVLYIDTVGKDKIIAGSDFGLIEGTRGLGFIREVSNGIKSAARIDQRRLLLAFSWGAGIFDLKDFRITDTLWNERATVVFYRKDTIYVGTLNGLYRSVDRQPPVFLGEKTPFLRRRIASIAESADGTLWIASYDDAGIIGYKNDRQTINIASKQGLTSDFCRTLLVHGSSLWAGTDRGLNRISLDKPGYPITQFTSKDGLASDMINDIMIDDSMVYVGTPAGLCYFDERKMTGSGHCLLHLLSLYNSDRDRIADTSHLVIPNTDKHIRFEYVGISYRSDGDITYHYRMRGLDDKWRETKENFIEYLDLPAGNYEWQLMAVNKFGVQSRLLSIPVEVIAPLWRRLWFIVAIWLASLALFWLLVSIRVEGIHRRQQEKAKLIREMNRLENTALKSQMNPHFIFNCLNSIQQSIFTGDTNAANNYIVGLARLIRKTLNNSSRSFVYIEEEIDYLSSYLQLEKLRFKERIQYELIIDPAIDQSAELIPPMLIQPYVENALHHGLGPRTDGKGRIVIRLEKASDRLIVTVEDNGVGRPSSTPPGQHSRERPGEHHSKGMQLTEHRLEILNKVYGPQFSITVMDLKDHQDRPTGTRILLSLPLFREESLYG